MAYVIFYPLRRTYYGPSPAQPGYPWTTDPAAARTFATKALASQHRRRLTSDPVCRTRLIIIAAPTSSATARRQTVQHAALVAA